MSIYNSLGVLLVNNTYIDKKELIELDIPSSHTTLQGIQFQFEGKSEILEISYSVEGNKDGCC